MFVFPVMVVYAKKAACPSNILFQHVEAAKPDLASSPPTPRNGYEPI